MGVNYFTRDDRDTRFVVFEQLDMEKILDYEAYRDYSRDDFKMIVEECFKVCRKVLGPAMQDGDRIGVRIQEKGVVTPDSYKDCWKVMAENGWIALGGNLEFGGQGLPASVAGMVNEVFHSANMPFMTFPTIAFGAGHTIASFGTESDKGLFVEKMFTGVWGGTMCLTEPDAGSDVGYLRTKAVPDPDSEDPRVFNIEGVKCFITSGEHDLTENIIHLVLARIQGSPMGTKGISLFIVPKIRVNPDGSLAEPNDVFCEGIEEKMGNHGSATTTLNFGEHGECRGILLGEPDSGMAKMFQLMNEARLACAIQALGLASAAYDTARHYAKERVQGPPFTNRNADRVPIIQHEDVRRMLMNLKSGTEGMRAFLGRMLNLQDIAEHDPDEQTRKASANEADLLLPVLKSYCADYGYQLIRDAIQTMGGVGYCRDFPVEQYARDSKIISIWEGTSYIQSLDLVGRKLGMEGGKVFRNWVKGILDFTGANKDDEELGADFKRLAKAASATADYAVRYLDYFKKGRLQLIPLTSTRFMESMGEVEVARNLLEQALIARDKPAGGVDPESTDGVFYRGKIETAKYFCRNTLVNVFGKHMSLEIEDTSALDIPEAAF